MIEGKDVEKILELERSFVVRERGGETKLEIETPCPQTCAQEVADALVFTALVDIAFDVWIRFILLGSSMRLLASVCMGDRQVIGARLRLSARSRGASAAYGPPWAGGW